VILGINTTRDISILSQMLVNNFEILLVVLMPNITTKHAITYTNWFCLTMHVKTVITSDNTYIVRLWQVLYFVTVNWRKPGWTEDNKVSWKCPSCPSQLKFARKTINCLQSTTVSLWVGHKKSYGGRDGREKFAQIAKNSCKAKSAPHKFSKWSAPTDWVRLDQEMIQDIHSVWWW